jgi:NitT/TauT family transport system permease protein
MRERLRYLVELVAFLAVVILLWELGVQALRINALILPDPLTVLAQFTRLWRLILGETLYTMVEALLGFALAVVVGLLIALGVTYWAPFRRLVIPVIAALNSTPSVVVAPIFVIWLGIELPSKVALAFLISFFPIVINAARGLTDVEPELLDFYRLLRAGEWRIFRSLRLPSSMPALFDGMKLALPIAIIGAIIAEFVASKRGIGYQILVAYSHFNTGFVFASVIVVAVVSTVLFQLLRLIERRVLSWREVLQ